MEDAAGYGLDHPGSRIALVAETFGDGRDVMVEGESGLLSCLPDSSGARDGWNRSMGELILNNRTRYKIYSGDKPNQLRGPQHHRAYVEELAKYIYAEPTWTQLQLGLRLGARPQNVVTTTPRPIPLIKELVERDNVVVTTGSTFDNAANLSEDFLDEVRLRYEGTRLGEQELYGRIVEYDGESVFKREWWDDNRYDPTDIRPWNAAIARYASLDTAETVGVASAYSALVVGDLQPDYRMPIRYVARRKLEFPELVEWTIDELAPFVRDGKLRGLLIEDASSGRQLIQTLNRSGPEWLRGKIIPVKPTRGSARGMGKQERWRAASIWAKRGATPLPYPHECVPWLLPFEEEVFEVPNATHYDQADSYSQLVSYVEERHAAFSRRWQAMNAGQVA